MPLPGDLLEPGSRYCAAWPEWFTAKDAKGYPCLAFPSRAFASFAVNGFRCAGIHNASVIAAIVAPISAPATTSLT